MSFTFKIKGGVGFAGLTKLKTVIQELFGWNTITTNWEDTNTNWNEL